MRFLFFIAVLIVVLNSCLVKNRGITPPHSQNDTLQFTYLYSEALKSKMLGRDEVAIDQFTQCLRMKPQSSASSYQLALISYNNGQHAKAKDYVKYCLALKPENEWYLLLRAEIAKQLNEKDVYNDIYDKLVREYPGNLEYNYELAVIFYENKKYPESLALLNKLTDQVGVNETVSFLKNHIYYEQKRYDAIQYELKLLSKTYPDSLKYSDMLAEFYLKFNQPDNAIAMYNDVLNKDSANLNAQYGIAWLYGKLNQYQKGTKYLTIVLQNDEMRFSRKKQLAELYYNSKNPALSKDTIESIFQLLANTNEVDNLFLTEYIAYLYGKRDYSTAEKYCKVSIKKFPGEYISWDYYFNVLLVLNRTKELNQEAQKALEYFPNQANVYFYIGYSAFLLKDYKTATDYLEMGLDYVIDNEELEKQFFLTLAESYHSLGKDKNSDKYFEAYLSKDTSNAFLMNNYAYYLAQRNIQLNKALNLSRRSIEIEPFNSSFLDTYSWILYSLAQYDKALNYIQRAYKYGGNKNPVILEHYGDILLKLGNRAEAIDRWKAAYSINKSKNVLNKIKEAGGE